MHDSQYTAISTTCNGLDDGMANLEFRVTSLVVPHCHIL